MLYAIASWLESPDNEALLLAEYDNKCMKVVAESCVLAAALIKNAANQVDNIEPPEQSKITAESIAELGALAEALDSSNDPALKKQASVIDELLLTIAASPSEFKDKRAAQEYRIEELKKKYENPSKVLSEANKYADVSKAIDNSNMTKTYAMLEAPLSTRYCPDHAGAQIARIGEHTWQCNLDKKIYNYDVGFTLANGDKVPGGDVASQTQEVVPQSHAIFDSRDGRLG